LLYSVLKKVFAQDIYVGASKKTIEYLQQIETKTKGEIDNVIKDRKMNISPLRKIKNSIIKLTSSPLKPKKLDEDVTKKFLNTLINMLFFKMAIRALKRNAIEICGKRSSLSPSSKNKTIHKNKIQLLK